MAENNQDEWSDFWTQDYPLVKEGTSMAIIIPAKIIKELHLRHGDKIRVTMRRQPEE